MIDENTLYIILIIITIIGYLLIIIFSFYYVFIPALRSNQLFDETLTISDMALDAIGSAADQIKKTNDDVQAFTVGFCNFDDDLTPAEKDVFWGTTFDDFCSDLDVSI